MCILEEPRVRESCIIPLSFEDSSYRIHVFYIQRDVLRMNVNVSVDLRVCMYVCVCHT